jgi:hypothetical protein
MRYPALILVFPSHLVSAEATEVFLKARDQTVAIGRRKYRAIQRDSKKAIPGLNAVILQVRRLRRETVEIRA